jgi:hypothetical protein
MAIVAVSCPSGKKVEIKWVEKSEINTGICPICKCNMTKERGCTIRAVVKKEIEIYKNECPYRRKFND